MNYQTTSSLSIAPGQTTPWAFDLTLLPHPIFFAYWDGVKAYDPATATVGEGNFVNSQLGPAGSTPEQMCASWAALARRWRLCYMSATVLQDGPDLANQGTIAVCQSTFEPRLTTCGEVLGSGCYTYKKIAYFDQTTEGPNFERAQGMPNAMIGRSREGAYVPLKLTDTSQQWQSEADHIIPTNRGTTYPSPNSGQVMAQTTFTHAYPFPAVVPFYGFSGNVRGDAIPGLLNGSVAHVCARNLSDQTSFTIQFRFGVEIQLDPSSTLTPQLKLSPPYDPQALDTYFAIARELKDGYPADYNCEAKMWGAIKGALKTIAPPLLTAVGGGALIPMVGPALDGMTAMGRGIRKNRQSRQQERSMPPQQRQVSRRQRRRQNLNSAKSMAQLVAESALPVFEETLKKQKAKRNVERSAADIERQREKRNPGAPVVEAL